MDQALYETFPVKSLRRRLRDAIAESKCPRCSGPHLRIACTKPRQGWEDDFEKEGFFNRPPPKSQARVQLAGHSLNLPHARILSVVCPLGRCLVDTCSDVSVARRDVLTAAYFVQEAVIVGHLGGESTLEEVGTLELGSSVGRGPAVLTDVFVVEPYMLPAGVVALLGVSDIRRLGLSLDAVMGRPDCFWDQRSRCRSSGESAGLYFDFAVPDQARRASSLRAERDSPHTQSEQHPKEQHQKH